jgi:lycopene cyclase domain-containing protein
MAIALHVAIALVYTTPWDNYLVATRVWWYDPALVAGFTIGWVPIEEYTFFILQPVLGGLWLWLLIGRFRAGQTPLRSSLRFWLTLAAGIIWMGAAAMLALGWQPGTYLALELVWALPPIALQLAFGADILWRNRSRLLLAIVPLTLYLSAADALAISWGTWTISPVKSLNIFVGGILPLEELIFFLLTNTLVAFGLTLIWAEASHARLQGYIRLVKSMTHVGPYAKKNVLNVTIDHTEVMQVQE